MSFYRIPTLAALTVFLAAAVASCIKAQPPNDTGDPAAPTAVSVAGSGGTGTGSSSTLLAYDPDMKVLFTSDCVTCHGGFRVDGNYRMTTYTEVMRDVQAGNAQSRLVTITQPNGSMYRYFSGSNATRSAKAAQVRAWVVTYQAQQTR